jgi:DNA topoisomerase I
VVKGMLNLPGQELFQWQDEDGALHAVSSGDVNDYLHEACGERFTAKDFRTWHGTVLALESVRKFCGEEGAAFTIKALLSEVSSTLGNTPAVCRKAYIHPDVLELGTKFAQLKGEGVFDEYVPAPVGANRGLTAAEHRLVAFLSRSQTKHPLSVL